MDKLAFQALYQKIGGEPALDKILADFYARMSTDILIGYFFQGKDLPLIARMQKLFLMRAMGITGSYPGKAPAFAHLELPTILSGHFDRRLRLLEETLRSHGLNVEDIRTWVGFEEVFRASIVRAPTKSGDKT